MHDEGVDLLLEEFHRQVRERPRSGRAIAHLAGILFYIVDESFKVAGGHCRINHQHVGRSANHANWCEVFHRVVGKPACGGAGSVRGNVALHQGVAIGRCACGGLAGNYAATAALVVNNETLLELVTPSFSDCAANHVAATACCYRNNVANGFRGECGLR